MANFSTGSAGSGGISFFILLVFNLYIIAFSYFFSLIFEEPSYCISIMPIVVISLAMAPVIIILVLAQIMNAVNPNGQLASNVTFGILVWGLMVFSPHGKSGGCPE